MPFWRNCNRGRACRLCQNVLRLATGTGAADEETLMSVGIEIQASHAGEAGHSGTEIRSDVQVRIEPRERGGIAIELQSRVKTYYGDSIRRQAEEALEALGVQHAQVTIHDEGALPFV